MGARLSMVDGLALKFVWDSRFKELLFRVCLFHLLCRVSDTRGVQVQGLWFAVNILRT